MVGLLEDWTKDKGLMIRYQKSDVRSSYCSIIEGADLERTCLPTGRVEGWPLDIRIVRFLD